MKSEHKCCIGVFVVIVVVFLACYAFPNDQSTEVSNQQIEINDISTGILISKYSNFNTSCYFVNIDIDDEWCFGNASFYDDSGKLLSTGDYNHLYNHSFKSSPIKEGDSNATKVNIIFYKKESSFLSHKNVIIFNKTFDLNLSNVIVEDVELPNSNITTNSNTTNHNSSSASITKFNSLDKNGDGKLTLVEFEELGEYIVEDSYWNGYSIEEAVNSEFDNLDINNDNYLSFKEFSRRY